VPCVGSKIHESVLNSSTSWIEFRVSDWAAKIEEFSQSVWVVSCSIC
jgi:hypothetical protein